MLRFAKCRNWRCDWHGPADEVLRAVSPFDPDDEVFACPKCHEPDPTAGCDEPGCTRDGSCGTPTPGGYRLTCGEHRPTPQEVPDGGR